MSPNGRLVPRCCPYLILVVLVWGSADAQEIDVTRYHRAERLLAWNLWVRSVEGADSTRLTTDGEEYWSYGVTAPRPSEIIASLAARPVLQWSPDSKRIAVQRMDERQVERMPIISHTSLRPTLYTYPYGLPGDSVVANFDIHVVDVESGENLKLGTDPQPYMTFTVTGVRDSTWVTVKWTQGGERLYYVRGSRGGKSVTLYEADLETGAARRILEETRATHVELNLDLVGGYPNWDVINGGQDVIWFSERDGWGHLYRFDGDGQLKGRITQGAWTVGDILHVDEEAGRIVFTARGMEPGRIPTMADLYAIDLDGSGLERLGGEDADHTVGASPDGRYFVDAWSRPDVPPVSVVRDRAGRVVLELERADVSRLEEVGWSPPEIFEYKARDGVTSMYGLLYKPSDFDPKKTYPVVEYIYPGPFIGSVGRWNFGGGALGVALRADQDALAVLGFIVVQMDHLGTPFRSKAIQDNYANQVNASLVANLKGKLFLMTGDMDDNVHPSMTYRVANALIAANKNFDFLILPDRAHNLSEPYVIRRRWDYFVEHLLGLDPPADYVIQPPPG